MGKSTTIRIDPEAYKTVVDNLETAASTFGMTTELCNLDETKLKADTITEFSNAHKRLCSVVSLYSSHFSNLTTILRDVETYFTTMDESIANGLSQKV